MTVNPHADEFDEFEWRLRQDVEEAIEQAAGINVYQIGRAHV